MIESVFTLKGVFKKQIKCLIKFRKYFKKFEKSLIVFFEETLVIFFEETFVIFSLEKYLIGDFPKTTSKENIFAKNTISRNTIKHTLRWFYLGTTISFSFHGNFSFQ